MKNNRILIIDKTTRSSAAYACLSSDWQLHFAESDDAVARMVEESLTSNRPYSISIIDLGAAPLWSGAEKARQIIDLDSRIEVLLLTKDINCPFDDIVKSIKAPGRFVFLRAPFSDVELTQMVFSLGEKWQYSTAYNPQKKVISTFAADSSEQAETDVAESNNYQDNPAVSYSICTTPAKDMNGQRLRAITVCNEMINSQQNALKIDRQEQLYRTLVESAPN